MAAEAARLAEEQRAAELAQAEAARKQLEQEAADAAEQALLQARAAEAKRVADAAIAARAAADALQAEAANQSQVAEQQSIADARAAETERLANSARAARARARELARAERLQLAEAAQARSAAEIEQARQRYQVTDEDFNSVYQRFLVLERAIEGADIAQVIAVTQPSGTKVQQLLQLFENNVSIDARLSNVATRNAEATIVGTLKIQRLIRADGRVVDPPSNLATIAISSRYTGDGWSQISW